MLNIHELNLVAVLGLVLLLSFVPEVFAQDPSGDISSVDSLGVRDFILDGFESLRELFGEVIEEANIEDSEVNPLNTTEAELQEVLDSAVDTGTAGAEFFFAFHRLFESVGFALSPIALNIILVSIIAGVLGVILIWKMGGDVTKHLFIFLAVILVVVLVMMVLQTDIEF